MIKEWLNIAQKDYKMAQIALNNQMDLYVAYHCQQSCEKSLKGLYLKVKNEQPPYVHDLGRIYSLLKNDVAELVLDSSVLEQLSAYYITTRYPSYKKSVEEKITPEMLKKFLETTQGAIQCLEQRLK